MLRGNIFMENNTSNTPDTATPEPARPTNLSSNLTLIFRVFLPVFGTVFISGLLLAFGLTDEEELYLSYSIWWPRALTALIWFGWLIFVWRVLWPLKRIDADDTHLFVTDYWTTVRYPWTDVESLQEFKLLRRPAIRMQLKAPGRFGQSIVFLPGSHFRSWMEEKGGVKVKM